MVGIRRFPLDLSLVADLMFLTDIFMLVLVTSGNFLRTTPGMSIVVFLQKMILMRSNIGLGLNCTLEDSVPFSPHKSIHIHLYHVQAYIPEKKKATGK